MDSDAKELGHEPAADRTTSWSKRNHTLLPQSTPRERKASVENKCASGLRAIQLSSAPSLVKAPVDGRLPRGIDVARLFDAPVACHVSSSPAGSHHAVLRNFGFPGWSEYSLAFVAFFAAGYAGWRGNCEGLLSSGCAVDFWN
jgi:hypothetical protein